MIHLLSHNQAEKDQINPGLVHSISPYLNPGHVLSPPRSWLEALLDGSYSWHFFRLRYKNLLRNRFRQDPETFFRLLDASAGDKPLYLTCHCLAGPCHSEIASEFMEILRWQKPYQNSLREREMGHAA